MYDIQVKAEISDIDFKSKQIGFHQFDDWYIAIFFITCFFLCPSMPSQLK